MLPHVDKIEEGQEFCEEASLKPISVKQVWDDGDLNEQSDSGIIESSWSRKSGPKEIFRDHENLSQFGLLLT